MKLTEAEKKYTWKQWLKVAWIAVRHPATFINYLAMRSAPRKTLEEQREEFNRKYVMPLEKAVKTENAKEIKENWRN